MQSLVTVVYACLFVQTEGRHHKKILGYEIRLLLIIINKITFETSILIVIQII